ncbi:hypothetical protein T440DRAFT_480809 [Plenodomus tracheiphilus IPT5]|uniref:Uncharacterized protein n=1 Tax=Plenodomus tracheiphilus IPT5 TaxID=1408161 RepID=A0A6A7AZC3_9PLEO|nr:hypothetical protein T440DRAFT_480809 [Plenodomus tracheiphilus IPT5]
MPVVVGCAHPRLPGKASTYGLLVAFSDTGVTTLAVVLLTTIGGPVQAGTLSFTWAWQHNIDQIARLEKLKRGQRSVAARSHLFPIHSLQLKVAFVAPYRRADGASLGAMYNRAPCRKPTRHCPNDEQPEKNIAEKNRTHSSPSRVMDSRGSCILDESIPTFYT